MSNHEATALSAAHRKIAAVRKIVEEFWARPNASQVNHPEFPWRAHVALVQLEAILRRSGGDKELIEKVLDSKEQG